LLRPSRGETMKKVLVMLNQDVVSELEKLKLYNGDKLDDVIRRLIRIYEYEFESCECRCIE